MTEKGVTVEFRLPGRTKPGREQRPVVAPETVPRIARLLALAWKWELPVQWGEAICADLAKRHGLSRARVTQICGLTLLVSDLRGQVLLLAVADDVQPLSQRAPRAMVHTASWAEQRAAFSSLIAIGTRQ